MPELQVDRTLPSGIRMQTGYYYVAAIAAGFYEGINGTGSFTLHGHPSASQWTNEPAERMPITLGEQFNEEKSFPTLKVLMQDPRFMQAVGLINDVLVDNLIAHHPAFENAIKIN